MKFGVYGLLWTPKLTGGEMFVLEKTKKMGFDGIEVSLIPSLIDSVPTADFRKAGKDLGIEFVTSTGLDAQTNIISGDPKIRRKGIDFLKKCVDKAAELGADVVAGVQYAPWAVFTGTWRTKDEIKYSVEALKEASEYAGKSKITFALEPVNRYEGYFLNTAEQGRELLKQIGSPYAKLHLDTFQMNIEEASMYEAIKATGKDLWHFHVCASYRGVPGTDLIDWQKVFKALKEIDYQRWMVIESFAPDNPDIVKNVSIWRQLAPSPDAIAKEGLAFLKKHLA